MDAIALKDAAASGAGLRAPSLVAGRNGHIDMAATRQAANAFEAQFLGQMFQLAMKDLPVDDMFGGGAGERVFRDLLTEEWAESTVRSGGVGIADAVMRTLIEAQGGSGR